MLLVPSAKMKPVSSLKLLILLVLALFVCALSFYNFRYGYRSATMCVPLDPDSVSKEPVSLNIPAGNCKCTLSYTPGHLQLVPQFSCDCQESSDRLQVLAAGNSSEAVELKCPDCPEPEIRFVDRVVEKQVVKEVEKKGGCPGVPWYAEGREWHFPARFPLCSMDVCFNYSRCENSEELLVYSYDRPSSPLRYFRSINESKYYTNDPQKACIFLVFLDTLYPWPERPNSLPYWNGGLNHVLVTFADRWEQKGPSQDSIGFASVLGTIVHETTYRAGFDVAIPLPGSHHMRELQTLKPLERKYLATFRGLRYLGARGDGTFRSHDSFRGMHNGKEVIVVTSCNQSTNKMIRAEHPELGAHCDEDEAVHANYTFADLMNSTFGIVPAGRQPASYRFIEVLSAGAIPVLIADNYVKPFDTLIQWHKCLLQFPTSEMHRIVPTLRAVKPEELLKRQENCLQFYHEFLKDDETLMRSSMSSLKARFLGAIPNLEEGRRKR